MSATYVGRAWSCTVRLVVEDERVLEPAAADLHALLERVDQAASRFRGDSQLTRANQRAGVPVPISLLLVELVEAALRWRTTPTDWSTRRSAARWALSATTATSAPWRRTGRRSRRDRRIGLARRASRPRDGTADRPRGAALDLGATAKAYTADMAAATLAHRYGTAVLVELGGDVAVAGERPDGWVLQVAEREGGTGQLVLIRHGGLTTTTTTCAAGGAAGARCTTSSTRAPDCRRTGRGARRPSPHAMR